MTGYPNEDEGPDEVKWPAEKSLLPCPFCQGAVQFRKALHICDGNTDAIIHAEPSNCGMAQFEDGSTDESIVAKWNTRSVNAVPDLVKALEPFAQLIDLYDVAHATHNRHRKDEGYSDRQPLPDSHRVSVSMGELRAARAALAKVKT
jgi:hypothetical protein